MKNLDRLLGPVVLVALSAASSASEVMVASDITVSTVWTADNTYNLQSTVLVTNGASLTIEAGTVVASDNPFGTLVVTRGSQIFIRGEDGRPVIMTSKADQATWTGGDPRTGAWREAAQEWGNLTVLGRAHVSASVGTNVPTCDPANEAQMEGLMGAFPGDPNVRYGGGDDDDDSGSITCLSLRYGGGVLGLGNELNGLSLGGVGRATDVTYVEVMNTVDDGIECFGGTVGLRYFSIWNVGDDSFDVDQGWRGKAQFGLIVQGYCQDAPQGSGVGDNCFELDGAENADWQPVTTATIYNCTVIGQPLDGDGATAWRDNARVQFRNCLFLDIGDELVRFDDDDGDGHGGYGAGGTLSWPATWATPFSQTSAVNPCSNPSQVYQAQSSGNLNEIRDSVLFNIADLAQASSLGVLQPTSDNVVAASLPVRSLVRGAPVLKGGRVMQQVLLLDPRPEADALTSAALAPLDGFFIPANYRGAFAPGENWLLGWTAADAFGFLPADPLGAPPCFSATDVRGLSSPAGPFTSAPGTAATQSPSSPEAPVNTVTRLLPGFAYTPPEARITGLRPLPSQRMTVFYPEGTPPVGGWPVLLYSPCGSFREANVTESPQVPGNGTETFSFGSQGPLDEICSGDAESTNPALNGFFYEALLEGWAVITVGTVGIDSKLNEDGKVRPFGIQLPPDRDPNLFYPYTDAMGMPTAEWLNFELYWGEKDFAWARQFVAENATELGIDNDLVVATGVSCGSVYAASIALGPDRAHATGSSQAMKSTKCAGFLGFETPAWWPAFNDEFPGSHWEGATPGLRAPSMADADPDDLAAASVSSWIREVGSHAVDTPALLVYDEGVAATSASDFDRKDSGGSCAGAWPTFTGDPCLTDALVPCVDCMDLSSLCAAIGLPDDCFCDPLLSSFCSGSTTDILDYTRAHDTWNGIILYQDLRTFGHPDSELVIESSILTDYPVVPTDQTAIFTNTSGTLLPTVSDDPLVQEYALSWLCKLRDSVLGSSSSCPEMTYRNAAPNVASLSVTRPIAGEVMSCVVDLRTTGHPMARVIALDTPTVLPLGTYNLLCMDSGSGVLFEEDVVGPGVAFVDVPLAGPMFLAGASFCVQAIHFGRGLDALSNAQDILVGL